MKKKLVILVGSLCLVLVMLACAAPTPTPTPTSAWEPPEYVGVAVTGTGTTGYASGMALFSAIEEATGVKFVGTPAAKTAGRALLLRKGIAHFAQNPALDPFFALEGIEDFAVLGPQSYRTLWDCGPIAQGLGTRANSGIKTMADLKGKRVASYPTYPIVQLYMDAILAYANLTWDDVVATPVASFAAGQRAVLEGAADVTVVSGTSGTAYEIEASIHGLHWVPMPNETAEDKAAWARYHELNPCFYPNLEPAAAAASQDNPVHIWGYNYQYTCYDWTDQDLVYWMVKQMHVNYDAFKDKHAYLKKWTVDHCLNSDLWFVPRAEGFINYFKDIGRWTPEMEAKQKELLTKYPQTMTK